MRQSSQDEHRGLGAIQVTPQERYEYSIADYCEALHMAVKGVGIGYGDEQESMIAATLRARLANWHETDSAYDNAYKELIKATLAEYTAGGTRP